MAKKKRSASTSGQMGLGLAGHVEGLDIDCRGLFSTIYLRKFLPSTSDFPSAAEVQSLYEAVSGEKLWGSA
jgi:hypothetical protein